MQSAGDGQQIVEYAHLDGFSLSLQHCKSTKARQGEPHFAIERALGKPAPRFAIVLPLQGRAQFTIELSLMQIYYMPISLQSSRAAWHSKRKSCSASGTVHALYSASSTSPVPCLLPSCSVFVFVLGLCIPGRPYMTICTALDTSGVHF